MAQCLIVPQLWHWDGNRAVSYYASSKEKQARTSVPVLDIAFINTGNRFLSFRKRLQGSRYSASYTDQIFN